MTGRSLLGKGVGALLGGGAAEGGAAAAGVGLAPLLAGAAVGAGISYEALSHRDAIDAWMTKTFGFSGDIAHGVTVPAALTESTHDRLKRNADAIAAQTGQNPSLIYDQLAHESGGGTNRGYRDLHNLSGIEGRDGKYRSFDSDADYDKEMSRILRRDLGSTVAANIADYSTRLKRGGYYEDSQFNYARGMQSFDGQYSGPTHVTNNVVVNAKTDAKPQDIAAAVKDTIADLNAKNSRFSEARGTGINQ